MQLYDLGISLSQFATPNSDTLRLGLNLVSICKRLKSYYLYHSHRSVVDLFVKSDYISLSYSCESF